MSMTLKNDAHAFWSSAASPVARDAARATADQKSLQVSGFAQALDAALETTGGDDHGARLYAADGKQPKSALSTFNPPREQFLLGHLDLLSANLAQLGDHTRLEQALRIAAQLGWNAQQLDRHLGLESGTTAATLDADPSLPRLYDATSGDYGRQLFAATNNVGQPKGLGAHLLHVPQTNLADEAKIELTHEIASQLGMSADDVDAFYGFEPGTTATALEQRGLKPLEGSGVRTVKTPARSWFDSDASRPADGDVVRNWDGSITVYKGAAGTDLVFGTRYNADGTAQSANPRQLLDAAIGMAKRPWSIADRGPSRAADPARLQQYAERVDPQFRPRDYAELMAGADRMGIPLGNYWTDYMAPNVGPSGSSAAGGQVPSVFEIAHSPADAPVASATQANAVGLLDAFIAAKAAYDRAVTILRAEIG